MKKLLALVVVVFGLYSCQQEKTAYVDNDLLKDNYKALQNSNQKFDAQQKDMQGKLQKTAQKFQAKVKDYQDNMETMGKDEQEDKRQELMKEQQKLQQKQQMQQSLFSQKKQSARDSLEDIMRNKIEKYAKSHNYAYVFGANDDDNILYADDSKDITQDVLDALNNDKGGQSASSSKSDKSSKK